MAAYQYKISSVNQAGLTLLGSLTVPVAVPNDEFTLYQEADELGSGLVRGLGFAEIIWHWGFLPGIQYTQLRTVMANPTGSIWLRSYDINNAWHDYSGVYVWPPKVTFSAGRVLDFDLLFRFLTQLTDLP